MCCFPALPSRSVRSPRRSCSARRGPTISKPPSARRLPPANGCCATASWIRRASIRARSAASTPRLIAALERVTVGATRPDLTLVLDVPAEPGAGSRASPQRDGGPLRKRGSRLPSQAARRVPRTCRARAEALRVGRHQPRHRGSGNRDLAGGDLAPLGAGRPRRNPRERCDERGAGGGRPRARLSASARQRPADRPRRGRSRFPRRLAQRQDSARLADRRPGGHRQGDARLSHRALRADRRRAVRRFAGCARRSSSGTPHPGAIERRPDGAAARGDTRPQHSALPSCRSTRCARPWAFSAPPRRRAAGGW